MTIQEWLDDVTKKLANSGSNSARLDALVLLEYALVTPRVTLLTHPETDLPATTLVRLDKALQQRLDGVPIAYITNKKEFYGRDFIVSPDVLIPRPETESMIEIIKSLNITMPRILDVGTGSGCIAITLALELPLRKILATDISADALRIARLNAKTLGAQVVFKQADMLKSLADKHFDIICANLPYVPDDLVTSKEIANEPSGALFSGTDGLDHYRQFFIELAELTNKPAYVVTESLTNQHGTLKKLAALAGYQLVKTDMLIQLFKKL